MHRNWKTLIKPNSLQAVENTATFGKYVAKPLERGYGVTLGNSIRRVLLSSINGAAVVAVRIEGVDHEFSTIAKVKEDVIDIILNIKQVNLRYLGERDTIIRIKTKKAKTVTAADIDTGGDVEILNPEQVICNAQGPVELEMIVRFGRGYVSADENKSQSELPAGFIAIDSIFAPIRRVAYEVSNARVGQNTEYDKLTLKVWTNGAVSPEDSIAYASKILKEQFTTFINFDERDISEELPDEDDQHQPKINDALLQSVDTLELSVRAANCLENADIKYIGELVTKSENEMLKTKNFGRKSLNEIKDILMEMGLSLGMTIEGFDPTTLRKK